jgi:hypothetical protein
MYFMLGDNTQNSSDSREWTFARYRFNDRSSGTEQVLRGNYEHNTNPWIDVGNPDGPVVWLRDEWGELHGLPQSDVQRLESETAPFVPRDMILGRAMATFWPLDPFRDVYRLGWVH